MPTSSGHPMLTGFCEMNQHEGTRPKSLSGIPMKVCTTAWCECECHKKLDEMFQMAGMERSPQDNPEYVPYKRDFWMPSDDPEFDLPAPQADLTAEGDVALPEREVKVTMTGRTQRGGLEFWVQRECLAWMLDPGEVTHCTPKFLSNEIARVEGIAPPSQGAIAAVFARWEKAGYAEIGHDRPQRFIRLTQQGKDMGLDWCKANLKKKGKA